MIVLAVIVSIAGTVCLAEAQHEQHQPAAPTKDTSSSTPTQLVRDTVSSKSAEPTKASVPLKTNKSTEHSTHSSKLKPKADTQPGESMSMAGAIGALIPGVPSEREGSGTSWLPDQSATHARHWQRDPWMLMLHGVAALRYTNQDASDAGPRGDDAISAPNWAMLMAMRPVGHAGQITLRAMLSLDRLTEGGDGYPLLFQTGESWESQPLVDQQHPHDFLMELAAAYGRKVGEHGGYFVYFGLPGEPALGPPAFMHRPSARNNLEAPLGHHWQDATHITFGVLTSGYVHKSIKLDASVFTGREPDEDRWGIDEPKFDSYSGRISYNPSPRFSLQFSGGRLESPEMLEPDIDLTRVTASALCHHGIGDGYMWNTAIIWGMNDPSVGEAQHSFLIESDWEGRALSPYGRLEIVQKPGHDLRISGADEELFSVGAVTLGVAVAVPIMKEWKSSASIQGTGYRVPDGLQGEYGKRPWSVSVQFQLSPSQATGHADGTH
jgi:hypothetical protein